MRGTIAWAWKTLAAVACIAYIAYQYGVYVSISTVRPGLLHTVLLWLPLVVLGGWVLTCSKNKPLWLAALLAATLFVYLMEYEERLGIVVVSGISHAVGYLFLLGYFGRTLTRGREPLITRFARTVHGALDPAMALFTRKVTMAWCLFFAIQLVASAMLFAFAPMGAWSLFINLLNLPLVALMFVGQFACRMICFPDCPQVSLWQAVQAFIKDVPSSNSAEVR